MLRYLTLLSLIYLVIPAVFMQPSNVTMWMYDSTILPDEYCIPCCETRSHGYVVVLANAFDDDCPTPSTPVISSTIASTPVISSTRIMSSSSPYPSTTPGCIPCCETRSHGYLVVLAQITKDDDGYRSTPFAF